MDKRGRYHFGCDEIGSFMSSAILAYMGTVLSVSVLQAAEWVPNKTIEMIIPTSPGGGMDQTGRVIQKLLQSGVGVDMTVVNKGGAGGGIAYSYMNQKLGDGHYLSLSLLNLVVNRITGSNPISYTDVTPICHLFSEYPIFVVKTDSAYKNGKDLANRLRQDPTSVTFAFSPGLGGAWHLATAMVAKAAGVDVKKLKLVVVQSSGEAVTSVLGGHVDVGVMNPSNAIPHLQTNRLRAVGVPSPQRLHGALANVATWKEQGIAAISGNWRGVIGPKGMTPEQIKYWEDAFAQLVKTDEWKQHLEMNSRNDEFMASQATKRYYEAQHQELRAVLVDLGLAK